MSEAKACPQCKGEGFYFRLPPGRNPFAASIEVTARNMRRIQCYCPAGRAALASPPAREKGAPALTMAQAEESARRLT